MKKRQKNTMSSATTIRRKSVADVDENDEVTKCHWMKEKKTGMNYSPLILTNSGWHRLKRFSVVVLMSSFYSKKIDLSPVVLSRIDDRLHPVANVGTDIKPMAHSAKQTNASKRR